MPSSQELSVWFDVMKQAAKVEPRHLWIFVGFVAGATGLGVIGQFLRHHQRLLGRPFGRQRICELFKLGRLDRFLAIQELVERPDPRGDP